MSTIQTSINLIHLQAGLSLPSVTQRTSNSSAFTANAIEVGTTDETIPLGDVTTPKQVMVKLVSGDPVKIGLDGSTYPFRLQDPDEATLLRLDVEGLLETMTITCPADSSDNLDGEGFVIEDENGDAWAIGVSIGDLSGEGVDHVLGTGLLTNNTAVQVAAAVYLLLSTDTLFSSLFTVSDPEGSELLIISNRNSGVRTSAGTLTDGDPSFGFSINQSGAASPVIHLQSTGTSQVVVAVAPH